MHDHNFLVGVGGFACSCGHSSYLEAIVQTVGGYIEFLGLCSLLSGYETLGFAVLASGLRRGSSYTLSLVTSQIVYYFLYILKDVRSSNSQSAHLELLWYS